MPEVCPERTDGLDHRDITALCADYEKTCKVAAALRKGGKRHDELRYVVTGIFAACLGIFYVLAHAGVTLGLVFFVSTLRSEAPAALT
jgi:hypothetical protein